MSKRLRWALGKAHLWLGILVGVYFAFLGITGSLLVFGREIDQWREEEVHRVVPRGDPVPLSRVLEGFHRVYPDQKVGYINYPRTPDGTYSLRESVNSWTQRYTYLDPYTGEIVGERTRGGTFYGALCYLHFYLAMGQAGWIANGYGAVLVTVVLLTGVAIWWPTQRGQWTLRLGLRRRSGGKVLVQDVHNAAGAWTVPLMLMFTFTAFVFAFKDLSETVVYGLTGVRKESKVKANGNGTMLPIDRLVAIADEAVDGRVQRVNFPKKIGEPLVVRKEWDNWNQTRDRVEISVDPVTGAVLRIDDSRRWPLGRKLIQWAIPLHFGLVGGLPTRILWVLLGLVPPLLGWTGWLQYRKKAKALRAAKERRSASAPGRSEDSPAVG